MAIARRYLEPQARTDAGVPQGSTSVTDPALTDLITEYARCSPPSPRPAALSPTHPPPVVCARYCFPFTFHSPQNM